MITYWQQIRRELCCDYFKALLLIALVPLFPEYISFFLIIGALVFAIKDIRTSGRKIKFGFLDWTLLAYCLYLTVTCFYSTHPGQSLLATAMWWFMLMAYLIAVNMITDKNRAGVFLFLVSTVAGIVGLIAFIQNQLNGLFGVQLCSVWDWLDRFVFQYVPFDLTLVPFPDRAYSTFPNPNMLAQYFIMAAPFVIAYNFIENPKGMRIYNRLCMILVAVGVMVSYSRGGYLALIALALVLIIVNIRKQFSTVLLYVCTALLFIPKTVYSRLTNLDGAGRQRIWKEAFRKIAERPLFGYGAGTQPSAAIFHSIKIDAPHAHSIILQPLMEGGLIALGLLLAMAVYLIKDGLKLMLNKNPASFWAGFAACGFVFGIGVHGLVDYPLTTPKLICCFMCLLALSQRMLTLYTVEKDG